jgi:hypothetical protein
MKRRDFLVASTGIAGGLVPALSRAATPCMPPLLNLDGVSLTKGCGPSATLRSGDLVLVGNNTQYDLVGAYPARFGALGTENLVPFAPYTFGYALNGAYGSGTYVPGWGAKGSYVVVNSAGDTAPAIYDAIIYDFDTNTWSVQVNADGVKNNSFHGDTVLQTSGAPYYEITGKPGVPLSAQWYRLAVGIGTRIIRTLGCYAGGQIVTVPYTHQYDLATARYSRLSDSQFPAPRFDWAAEPSALHDVTANRIWVILNETGGSTYVPYFDLNDNTWKKSASFPGPSTTGSTANWQHALLHDDGTNRCILTFRNSSPNYARVLNLNNIGAGWVNVTLAGDLSQFTGGSNALSVRWAQYPVDKSHYTYDGLSSAFTRISPPASGITGTWTVTQIAPATGTIPTRMNGGGVGETSDLCHYTRFFYVPPLGSFAWVAGGTRRVALWKP